MSDYEDHLTLRIHEADMAAKVHEEELAAFQRGVSFGLRYARLYYGQLQKRKAAPPVAVATVEGHTS